MEQLLWLDGWDGNPVTLAMILGPERRPAGITLAEVRAGVKMNAFSRAGLSPWEAAKHPPHMPK
jgi:hypothetical protein